MKCDYALEGCVSCGETATFKATSVSSNFKRYLCEKHVQKRITRNIVEPWLIERLDEEGNPIDLIKDGKGNRVDIDVVIKALKRFPKTSRSGHNYCAKDVTLKTTSRGINDTYEAEVEHAKLILDTINDNKDKLCFVRVLPELKILEDGKLHLYTRLQFADRDDVGWELEL
jgi:hypothetical protein